MVWAIDKYDPSLDVWIGDQIVTADNAFRTQQVLDDQTKSPRPPLEMRCVSTDYYLSVSLLGLSSVLWLLPEFLSGRWRQWHTWGGVRESALAVRTPFEKGVRWASLVLALVGIFVALH